MDFFFLFLLATYTNLQFFTLSKCICISFTTLHHNCQHHTLNCIILLSQIHVLFILLLGVLEAKTCALQKKLIFTKVEYHVSTNKLYIESLIKSQVHFIFILFHFQLPLVYLNYIHVTQYSNKKGAANIKYVLNQINTK